jgi:hypothetical protein
LKEAERHLGEATIHIRHATFEDADDLDHRGGKRPVPAAADEGQFVTNANLEISCQHTSNDDFLRHRIVEKAAILDEAGKARHVPLELGLHPCDLKAVAPVGARHQGKGRSTCDHLV